MHEQVKLERKMQKEATIESRKLAEEARKEARKEAENSKREVRIDPLLLSMRNPFFMGTTIETLCMLPIDRFSRNVRGY